MRSDSQPESSRTPVAIASAIPSTIPTAATGAPSVIVRNSGTIGYASSLAASLASETQPRMRTFSGSRRRAASIRATVALINGRERRRFVCGLGDAGGRADRAHRLHLADPSIRRQGGRDLVLAGGRDP